VSPTVYLYAADAVLLLHTSFVFFVVVGLAAVLIGGALRWPWVRNRAFRILHLVAIGVVVLQAWLGVICPLTTLEMALRSKAGDAVYEGTFISHWLSAILYYQAPAWVFVACYTAFGLLVAGSWVLVRPHPRKNKKTGGPRHG
jgi:multisubunit Na+/H+ antiporter MnhB subunit